MKQGCESGVGDGEKECESDGEGGGRQGHLFRPEAHSDAGDGAAQDDAGGGYGGEVGDESPAGGAPAGDRVIDSCKTPPTIGFIVRIIPNSRRPRLRTA